MVNGTVSMPLSGPQEPTTAPLAGGSLAACAEAYFAQSEQLPTRFSLSFGKSAEPGVAEHWRAGTQFEVVEGIGEVEGAVHPVEAQGF